MNLKEYLDYLVKWLQNEVNISNAKGVIFGLSGGIDSAVVAAIAKKSFPSNSLALIMPCHSNDQDQEDAILVAKNISCDYKLVKLDEIYDTFIANNPSNNQLATANIKARLRMSTLYYYAQINNYLVLGTDNYDEWYTGYFTKYGDGAADLVPLIHLLKSEVYQLARYLNIPDKIIKKQPSAGLIANQTDEMELKVSYQTLDNYLKGESVIQTDQRRIEYLHHISEHKRNMPRKPDKNFSVLK